MQGKYLHSTDGNMAVFLIKSMHSWEKLGTKVPKNQCGDILQGRREKIAECKMELEGTSAPWFLPVRINDLLTLSKGIRKGCFTLENLE